MPRTAKALSRLTPNQIHDALVKQNLPYPMRVALYEKAVALKNERRKAKLRTHTHASLWRRLLVPLKYELSNAKVGARLKDSMIEPERHTAFTEYIKVLDKMRDKLERIQLEERNDHGDEARTPTEIAKENNLPYAGAHWVDWIPMKVQDRIHTLFDSVPYKSRAKRFVPFQRRMPLALYEVEHSRLWLRTLNEYDLLISDMNMEQDPDKQTKLIARQKRMLFALDKLAWDDKHPCLPMTWHGVYEPEEWAHIDDNEDPVLMERLYETYHDKLSDHLALAREEK